MIITKILGLTSALTKSKKAKLGILAIEMGLLIYAIRSKKLERKEQELINKTKDIVS
ncbi:hypothetical protein [Hanstruepera ponticola]|uniref:hypothetical protein n=1 Tax=Hanstruepera ponticola TaxID=2042995 RepID=UPI0013C4D305|nr:hypothetical protein [Hanstruepera ponticola]